MKGPGSEKARERKGQGAKVPESESSRERIGQGPIGRFAPGSELARERKGSVPDHLTGARWPNRFRSWQGRLMGVASCRRPSVASRGWGENWDTRVGQNWVTGALPPCTGVAGVAGVK